MSGLRLLLVGAGAIGQVYARHLQMGGAEIAFFVRPKYAALARDGFDLYPLGRRDARKEPVRLEHLRVFTSADEVKGERFDAVLLCVASNALRDGTWLTDLAAATGDATILAFQPGLTDKDHVVSKVGSARLVMGMIGMVSYPAPLPGESVPRPGIAYWLPPFSETPLSGARERVLPLVAALQKGGIRSRAIDDAQRAAAVPSAVLSAVVAALEASGWLWKDLRAEDHLSLAARAAREGAEVAMRKLGGRVPFALKLLLRPTLLSLVTRLAPLVAPLDIETYFRVHFEKVGEQMHMGLRGTIALAERDGLPADATRELLRRIGARASKIGVVKETPPCTSQSQAPPQASARRSHAST